MPAFLTWSPTVFLLAHYVLDTLFSLLFFECAKQGVCTGGLSSKDPKFPKAAGYMTFF